MTTTSQLERPDHQEALAAPTWTTVPEPLEESVGVDDPQTAHGGRSRRAQSPPATSGLVQRVRSPEVLRTSVRRV